jgi:hypothetical protein
MADGAFMTQRSALPLISVVAAGGLLSSSGAHFAARHLGGRSAKIQLFVHSTQTIMHWRPHIRRLGLRIARVRCVERLRRSIDATPGPDMNLGTQSLRARSALIATRVVMWRRQ